MKLSASCQTNPSQNPAVSTSDQRRHSGCLFLSFAGQAFIKDWEKIVLKYYDDDFDYCTAGWGHLVKGKRSCRDLGIAVNTPISLVEAERFFRLDVSKHEDVVRRAIRVPLYQHEFDALCSLAFNVGDIAKVAPMLCHKINTKRYAEAARELLDITNRGIPGLVKRRRQEYDMYISNLYDSTH
ncbi:MULTISPECIES: lysozyme [unclassified Ralstonia]|uniref:lysozyme n=1 Tax=unclassified Ralstonia TaxID=209769 RepID=UPI002C6EB16A|nr:lysozyme [Ralstonia sp.]HWV05150.1 lysozyme [Ralstonia sp.]